LHAAPATWMRGPVSKSQMSLAAALIYWVIIFIWLTVLATLLVFYIRNPRVFGTTRLLLAVVAIDTLRNIAENVYFGLYFGGQYGLFPSQLVTVLANPYLLIIPKVLNVVAGCVVLGLLLLRWLPSAITEHEVSEQTADDLKTLAAVDGLTGLYNRRQFEMLAAAEWARFQRYLRPLSVLIIDVDHFKAVNDRFGHDGGDSALKIIATVCASAKRDSDISARIGGEEFALLLPETSEAAARIVAERLCAMVRECSPTIQNEKLSLSVSVGIATATVSMSGIAALMKRGDDALYQSKRSGRDRVTLASELVVQRIRQAAE
jgi:diguanylate cyclase (GGDEF)-like protein